MKKKALALVLGMSMLLGMTACGNSSTQGSASSAPGSSQSSQTSSDTTQSSTTPSDTGNDGGWNFEGITLNIAHSTTGEVGDALQAQFDAFEELTGCKIEVELLSSDSEEAVYTLEVRAATGNLPDIFQSSIGAQLDKLDPAAQYL